MTPYQCGICAGYDAGIGERLPCPYPLHTQERREWFDGAREGRRLRSQHRVELAALLEAQP